MQINPNYSNDFLNTKVSSNEKSSISNLIKTDRMIDSFISMAKLDTASNPDIAESGVIPSTEKQKTLAKKLFEELKQIGLTDIEMDKFSNVTATFKENITHKAPTIGLFAHIDTSSEVPTENIEPIIHNYKSGNIKLNDETVISAKDLKPYKGQKIITSNGKTLLGADDKAGIAEILEALRVFKENPNLQHPRIKVAFTPDEETGCGISKFDLKKFGADLAYTIDGDVPCAIENESFNAFNPEIIIKGKNVHTGYAKGKMINSINVANWMINKLPKSEVPEKTSGKEGFYHVGSVVGDTSQTKINMLVRDHNWDRACERIDFIKNLIKQAEQKFKCQIEFNPKEKYHNMKEAIDKFPEVLEYAKEGIKRSGFIPTTVAIRGGTDGSSLSLQGLPTPNLGAGGHNFHSKNEFLPINEMKKCAENIIHIMMVWAEKTKDNLPKIRK